MGECWHGSSKLVQMCVACEASKIKGLHTFFIYLLTFLHRIVDHLFYARHCAETMKGKVEMY